MTDALEGTLEEIAAALDGGRLTATELAEAAVARHDRLDATLQAYATWAPEQALATARAADAAFRCGIRTGPFQGIPISAKDLFGVAGLPTFAGTPRRLPPAFETEGPLIRRQRQDLGLIMGKTRMVEFGLGGTGVNAHWATPRNPWDAEAHRSPGGFSSGAGVSLAEGSALVAWGTDTMGSVRMPASLTGNVGLKVTAGRWPTDGIVPLSRVFDTPGLLVRSVADAAYCFGALDPHAAGALGFSRSAARRDLHGVKLGLGDASQWEECEPGIAEAAQAAVDELARAGARVLEARLPEAEEALAIFREGPVPPVELRAFLDHELPDWLETLDPYISPMVRGAETLGASVYQGRLHRLARAGRSACKAFDEADVLVCPTVPVSPPLMSELDTPERHWRANGALIRNTCPVNLLGLCAITIPIGLDSIGMPAGLQLTAPPLAEGKLLSIALGVEQVLGISSTRIGQPPLVANS